LSLFYFCFPAPPKDPWGEALPKDSETGVMTPVKDWPRGLSYTLNPPQNDRSLCQYLAEVSESQGVRSYVDWIVGIHYSVFMAHWALAQELNEVRERSHFVCFRDMESSNRTHVETTIQSMLNFLYSGNLYQPWHGTLPDPGQAGGHKTPPDPELRERLIETIKRLDETYYNGEIGWLHSVLPCQNRPD